MDCARVSSYVTTWIARVYGSPALCPYTPVTLTLALNPRSPIVCYSYQGEGYIEQNCPNRSASMNTTTSLRNERGRYYTCNEASHYSNRYPHMTYNRYGKKGYTASVYLGTNTN